MTRKEIDALGERLRSADRPPASDLTALDEFRRSYTESSNAVTVRLRDLLALPITERPGKTTPSIIAKLRRQRLPLSRMQDIAGGRVVVPGLNAQDEAWSAVRCEFTDTRSVDRRISPVVGYHAVHVVIKHETQSYELQIRTTAQQRWAQLSEKVADLVGFEIKYGGGEPNLSRLLTVTGGLIYTRESTKQNYEAILRAEDRLAQLDPNYLRKHAVKDLQRAIAAQADALDDDLAQLAAFIDRLEADLQ